MTTRLPLHFASPPDRCTLWNCTTCPRTTSNSKCRTCHSCTCKCHTPQICPPETAFALHEVWPEMRLRLVPGAGHSMYDPGLQQEVRSCALARTARALMSELACQIAPVHVMARSSQLATSGLVDLLLTCFYVLHRNRSVLCLLV